MTSALAKSPVARPAPLASPKRPLTIASQPTGKRKGIEFTIRRRGEITHRSHGLASAVCQIWSKRGACSTWNVEKDGCYSSSTEKAQSNRGRVQS
jgi:hypothetical protein